MRIASIAALFIAVFAVLLWQSGPPHSDGRLDAAEASAAAKRDHNIRDFLEQYGYSHSKAVPFDERLERVSFFNGSRIIAEAAVSPSGKVEEELLYRPGFVRSGSDVAQDPPLVLILFCVTFALATLKRPLLSIRTLDVVFILGFAVQAVLLNGRLFSWSVIVASLCLFYLIGRCTQVGVAPTAVRAESPTLLELVLVRSDVQPTNRPLKVVLAGLAIALLLLSIPGGVVGDVGLASLEGATRLTEGVLPYGNLSGDALHGDTYPLLAYAAYLPSAVVSPVQNAFSNLEGALYVAAGFGLIAAGGMYTLGKQLSSKRSAGPIAALIWLSFPPLLLSASSGANDIAVAACIAWALALSARAASSSALLSIAGWMKVVPALVLPLWITRLRHRAVRGLLAVTAVTAACLLWLILMGGVGAVSEMVQALSFQTNRGSPLSLWYWTGAGPQQAAVRAAAVTLICYSAVRAWCDEALAQDLARLSALSAAAILLLLLGANYFTWSYMPWVFPFIAAALLLPTRGAQSAT